MPEKCMCFNIWYLGVDWEKWGLFGQIMLTQLIFRNKFQWILDQFSALLMAIGLKMKFERPG
jgi:hypothetical protein